VEDAPLSGGPAARTLPGRPCEVQVGTGRRDDHLVVAVRGTLTAGSADTVVRRALDTHLLDRGRVVVDLSQTDVPEDCAVQLFPAALAGAGGWPRARLVLAGADPLTTRVLQAARVHLTVPVARTLEEARSLLDVRPRRVARDHELPNAAIAPALARAFVASACEDWALRDGLRDAAASVVTELVSNVVEHAGTACGLHLERDRRCLQIAVRDGTPVTAGGPPVAIATDRGYGLLIVKGLARGWGVTPYADGKAVWALLDATRDPLIPPAGQRGPGG
jgi:anti-anti-sigma regulatory factor/anti-sigma regulatory factor (Ser/Thr protein kinase)